MKTNNNFVSARRSLVGNSIKITSYSRHSFEYYVQDRYKSIMSILLDNLHEG